MTEDQARLIAKWRAIAERRRAGHVVTKHDLFYAKACDQCADDLEALLVRAVAPAEAQPTKNDEENTLPRSRTDG